MNLITRTILPAAFLLASLPALRAEAPADLSGHYEGAIQAPGREVIIEVDLARNSKGELAGLIYIPEEKLDGLTLANFALEGKSIRFQMGVAPGDRIFQGGVLSDGRISGDYTLGGYSAPFSLARTGDSKFEAPAKSTPISKELEGTWKASVDFNGVQRSLVLTMSNQSDGTYTASVLNVEEGLIIPVSGMAPNASGVTLALKAVGASYSASLNAERTELAGTFSEGKFSGPLNFTRASAGGGK